MRKNIKPNGQSPQRAPDGPRELTKESEWMGTLKSKIAEKSLSTSDA